MSTCSICLNSIRKTRSTEELPCGHLYHKKCIGEWEDRGNDTCPMCRKNTHKNNFKVTLHIENVRTDSQTSLNLDLTRIERILNYLELNIDDLQNFSSDIVFDANDLESLESILGEFGVSLPDVDASVLNTE